MTITSISRRDLSAAFLFGLRSPSIAYPSPTSSVSGDFKSAETLAFDRPYSWWRLQNHSRASVSPCTAISYHHSWCTSRCLCVSRLLSESLPWDSEGSPLPCCCSSSPFSSPLSSSKFRSFRNPSFPAKEEYFPIEVSDFCSLGGRKKHEISCCFEDYSWLMDTWHNQDRPKCGWLTKWTAFEKRNLVCPKFSRLLVLPEVRS